jgi:hypothetical protein
MKNKLVVTHDAGFFSCCTIRLRSIIDFYNLNKCLPEVDSSRQWSNYKDDPSYSDITHLLFKTKETELNSDNVVFSYDEIEDQFSDYNLLNFNDINFFIDKYFSPSDDIINNSKFFIDKYNINTDKIISVLFRGNDKSFEIHLPSYSQFLSKIEELKSKNPEYKLLVQTDENEFCDFILSKYSDSIVINELKRINRCDTSIQFVTPIGERFNLAKNFLSVMNIISKSPYLITNKGNVGMWSCLFRGNINNVHII